MQLFSLEFWQNDINTYLDQITLDGPLSKQYPIGGIYGKILL